MLRNSGKPELQLAIIFQATETIKHFWFSGRHLEFPVGDRLYANMPFEAPTFLREVTKPHIFCIQQFRSFGDFCRLGRKIPHQFTTQRLKKDTKARTRHTQSDPTILA